MTRAAVILAAVSSAVLGAVVVGLGAYVVGCPVPFEVLSAVAVVEGWLAGVASWATYTRTMREQPLPDVQSTAVALASEAAAVAGEAAVVRSSYTRARTLAHLFETSPVGLCRVGRDGVITHMQGGATEEIETTPEDWIGQTLTEPYLSKGFGPATEGRTVVFLEPDPMATGLQQVIMYAPDTTRGGRIRGATIWWMNLRPGQRFEEVCHAYDIG